MIWSGAHITCKSYAKRQYFEHSGPHMCMISFDAKIINFCRNSGTQMHDPPPIGQPHGPLAQLRSRDLHWRKQADHNRGGVNLLCIHIGFTDTAVSGTSAAASLSPGPSGLPCPANHSLCEKEGGHHKCLLLPGHPS